MDEEMEPVFSYNIDATAFANTADRCPHNGGIKCDFHKCAGCGWNPENVGLRNQRIIKVLEAHKIWAVE